MRRHGWGGDLPTEDADARRRIVDAARVIVRATGSAPTVVEVADALSVSRATVYRYYPSAEALLLAAASGGVESFLDDIADGLSSVEDPEHAVVEGIAYTLEEIGRRAEVALVLAPPRGPGPREMTSAVTVELGRNVLESAPVDWYAAGYRSADDLDALAEFMLRILQSLVVDPGDPPLTGDRLRAYLHRWVGPAVTDDQAINTKQRPTDATTKGAP